MLAIYRRTVYLAALGVIVLKTMALLQILWINAKKITSRIEKDEKYFQIGKDRIENHKPTEL